MRIPHLRPSALPGEGLSSLTSKELANQLIIQTRQYISWQTSPDEALQTAIEELFPDASDDSKADLFAKLCEAENFELPTVQHLVEKTIA